MIWSWNSVLLKAHSILQGLINCSAGQIGKFEKEANGHSNQGRPPGAVWDMRNEHLKVSEMVLKVALKA